ncbi:MAG: hypothetical protein HRU35_00860 [Rickettsiaceae bacterium]|nr:hypothetical protein [Rickettsiaceae bacterium]
MKIKNFILILLPLFLLSGCFGSETGGRPKILSFSPRYVYVDHSETDIESATELAQKFCSMLKGSKNAQIGITPPSEQNTSDRTYFNCVSDGNNNNNGYGGGSNNPNNTPIINYYK